MTVGDAIVIGAGPAGLATSRELSRRGVAHVVLERGDRPGHTWAHLYDSLVLHTGKHLSALPGLPFSLSTPLFPARRDFVDYLQRYCDRFDLPVATGHDVVQTERTMTGWQVRTRTGEEFVGRALVIATGIVSNPHVPAIRGRDLFGGRVAHSVEYRTPHGYAGKRVLIVGIGNSAGEIAVELARSGAHVVVSARSGRRVVPREIAGVPVQYLAVALARLPRRAQRTVAATISKVSERLRGGAVIPPPSDTACPDVPLIGLHFADAVRDGSIRLVRGDIELTARGARMPDGSEEPFDEVMLATGYRAALVPFGGAIDRDECGFGRRQGRVRSAQHPDLFFAGHNYDLRGALRNISQDAGIVANAIANLPALR